jgi:hypothetical protein
VSKAGLQVAVDGGEVEPVIQWQQHKRHYHIAYEITNNHLHVGKAFGIYLARHTHKGNSAERSAYHAIGYQKPVAVLLAYVKGFIGGTARGVESNAQQHYKVG